MIIPPRQKKMPGRGKKKCVNLTAFWFVNAVVNIVGDLVVFALPVPILWKLQMPWGEKVGLLPVFGLGVL